MKVVALLPYPHDTVGGQRYRLEQWQPELGRLGIDIEFHHLIQDSKIVEGLWSRPPRWRSMLALSGATVTRMWKAFSRANPDVVVVYREASLLGPPIIEAITALRVPVVLDFDDAIWRSPHASAGRSLTNLIRMPWKTSWIIRMSAGVSAGNPYLADYAQRYSDNVAVVPSTIDTEQYRKQKEHSASDPIVIGWSGSKGTAPYLEEYLPALADIAHSIPLRLRVIGAEVSHSGLEIELVRWRPETEVDDLLPIDIGVMPLRDDPWTKGKCGMKALQYMACGIPPIVSPVGVNSSIVTDGVNGYVAGDPEQWRRAIEALRDPARRDRLGGAARRTIVERFSAQHGARSFAAVLKSVAQRQ